MKELKDITKGCASWNKPCPSIHVFLSTFFFGKLDYGSDVLPTSGIPLNKNPIRKRFQLGPHEFCRGAEL